MADRVLLAGYPPYLDDIFKGHLLMINRPTTTTTTTTTTTPPPSKKKTRNAPWLRVSDLVTNGADKYLPHTHLDDSKVHGAIMGPTGPRWAPCWPHELCYLGGVAVCLHKPLVTMVFRLHNKCKGGVKCNVFDKFMWIVFVNVKDWRQWPPKTLEQANKVHLYMLCLPTF